VISESDQIHQELSSEFISLGHSTVTCSRIFFGKIFSEISWRANFFIIAMSSHFIPF
jgi:hypothetical protein